MQYGIIEYIENGSSPFHKWISALDGMVKARVFKQLARMENGNLGDSKGVGAGCGNCGCTLEPDTGSTMAGMAIQSSSC